MKVKYLYFTGLFLLFTLCLQFGYASENAFANTPPDTVYVFYGIKLGDQGCTLDDLLLMTPQELVKIRGGKYRMDDIKLLSHAQHKIIEWRAKGIEDATIVRRLKNRFVFHAGGFLLGLILGPIGVIIAWPVWGKNAGISSLFGLGGWVLWMSVLMALIALATWWWLWWP